MKNFIILFLLVSGIMAFWKCIGLVLKVIGLILLIDNGNNNTQKEDKKENKSGNTGGEKK